MWHQRAFLEMHATRSCGSWVRRRMSQPPPLPTPALPPFTSPLPLWQHTQVAEWGSIHTHYNLPIPQIPTSWLGWAPSLLVVFILCEDEGRGFGRDPGGKKDQQAERELEFWVYSRETLSWDINRGQKAARGWEVGSGIFAFNLQVMIMSLGLTSG